MVKSALSMAPSQTPSTTRIRDQQGATPAVVARDRPVRKAKQMALEQKVWTSDLPATRKRAVSSSGADKAPSAKPKKAKRRPNQAKSSVKGAATAASVSALDTEGAVNIPPRFARKGNVLLATDLDSSGDEEDIPLSVVERTASKAPAAPSTEKTAYIHDFQDPEDDGHNSDGDGSDDDIDPEARDQALAEMSKSDDEVLTSMEARGETQALGARLAAESQPEPALKGKGKDVARRITLELDDDLEESSGQEPKPQTKRKLKLNQGAETAAGLSKTELRAQQERPVFKTLAHSTGISQSTAPSASNTFILAPSQPTETAADDDSSASDSDFDMASTVISTGEAMAPQDYQIVYPRRAGVLSLKAQHPDIQDALQAAIIRLGRKIVLEDAFPDTHKRGRGVRLTIVEAARDLTPQEKYSALLTRLITDATFTKTLSTIPNQRISSFRRKIKEKSDIAVPSLFALVSGQAREIVEWLLPHLIYIYPVDLESTAIVALVIFVVLLVLVLIFVSICAALLVPKREVELRSELLVDVALTDFVFIACGGSLLILVGISLCGRCRSVEAEIGCGGVEGRVWVKKHHVSDSQPYKGQIVMSVLRESFFKGARSFSLRNKDIFRSSLLGRDEREIPMVMLALVGTAIHASLAEWKSGYCIESNFSSDKYMDAYGEHMIFLEAIKRSSPLKYHTMMYKLFDEASGGARTVPVAPLGDPAIAHLNLEAMEED